MELNKELVWIGIKIRYGFGISLELHMIWTWSWNGLELYMNLILDWIRTGKCNGIKFYSLEI
jgi:hypothetical protein